MPPLSVVDSDEMYEIDGTPTNELLDVETGMYTREVFLPARSIILGKVHKRPCINIITKGKLILKSSMEDEGILVKVENGKTLTFKTGPGSQKIAFIFEDTIVINVFSKVESTNLSEIEEELVEEPSKEEKELLWRLLHPQLVEQ